MKKENDSNPSEEQLDYAAQNCLIKIVHLMPHVDAHLDSMLFRNKPLNDANIPYRDLTNIETKKVSLAKLIEKLNVETSIRYQRTPEDTYCNVYAYDYCLHAKVYLPTIWWTEESLKKIEDGEDVDIIYPVTVDHIYSSAIHDWFKRWGHCFGWVKMMDLDEIQNKINTEGGVGIICAKRKEVGLSGHIVSIVPETATHKAYREDGIVVYPLQSQAGILNFNYFSEERKDWWNDELYSSFVVYYHE